MNYFGLFRGYICTANEDASIPINSKVVGQVIEQNAALITQLVAQANYARRLHSAAVKAGLFKDDPYFQTVYKTFETEATLKVDCS